MRWYERDNVKKTVLLTGITLVVYLAMRYVLPAVMPFLLGGLLALALNPVVEKVVERTHRGRGMVSMLVIILVLAAVGTGFYFAGREICAQLSSLARRVSTMEEDIRGFWCSCCVRIERGLGVRFGEADELFTKMQRKLQSGFQSKTLPYLLKNSYAYAKAVFSVMGVALVSVISGLLMLTDYPKIAAAVRRTEAGRLAARIKNHAKEAGGTYLKAQVIILLVISLICVAGLFLAGNPYALLAGMGIGLCDALPFIGTGTIFVPWMLIDILNGKYVLAAVYGILYIACSFVRQLLEPRLIGGRLGYPPIVILMSIYIGLHVYGAAGVLLGPASAFLIYELYTAAWDAGL